MSFLRACLLVLLLACLAMSSRAQLATFDTATVTVDSATGPQRFTVEMALTPQQQEQGLMFRRSLAPDAGMLFVFPKTEPLVFWMKNTYIPLDMLFIADNGRIIDIHERAVPLSEATIAAKEPGRAVLELNGGTVARLGIKLGGFVHNPVFGNAQG